MASLMINLDKYKEGILKGKWVDLPMREEDLEKEINEILGKNEEYYIIDYEGNVKVEEYANIGMLNDIARRLKMESFFEDKKHGEER